jgi:Methyltransferase domain
MSEPLSEARLRAVQRQELDLDPFLHDPARWGASMAHHAELLLGCLDVVRAKSVAEIGAYAGDLTRLLVAWAERAGATVTAIDPSPQPSLVSLAAEHDRLELIRESSLSALRGMDLPEALIIDGDHNYYTVSEELRLIGERCRQDAPPLLLFHDVCWPHGRRDDYFDAQQIPADYRHPSVGERAGIFPGDPGSRGDGLPYPRSAAREGGARNGVLTAVEDFISERERLRLVVVPAFFGFGVVWHQDVEWASELEDVLGPWDRSPLLKRLEANRVLHIAQEHALRIELWAAQERLARQEAALRRLLESSAFKLAEQLSGLRVRAGIAADQSAVSRDEIRRALSH